MNEYELIAIFPIDKEKAKVGQDSVKATLSTFGATISKEEPFGDRDLAYTLINKQDNQKEKRGHYLLFTLKVNPDKIADITNAFKITPNLLKYMFVKKQKSAAQ